MDSAYGEIVEPLGSGYQDHAFIDAIEKFDLIPQFKQPNIRLCEKGVAIDPGFSEAHGNLGVHYFKLGRLEEAAHEFRCAIELDPSTSLDHSNLAVTMVLLRRPEEAETEAQTAIGLDGANFRAHFVLGILMARRREMREQAAEHLLYAAREVPEAHLELAQLFRAEGDERRATLELDTYYLAIAPQPVK